MAESWVGTKVSLRFENLAGMRVALMAAYWVVLRVARKGAWMVCFVVA